MRVRRIFNIYSTMGKPKKLGKVNKRRRTSLEIEEEQSRTLYIRIPHTIKNAEEIKDLFFGDLTVKIPRQSSRHCHVVFPTIEEKIKNLKLIKKKLIDGKPIFAGPPRPINLEKKKKSKQKKIVIPEPKDDPKIGKYLIISNIAPGVKASEIKDAFPGSVTVALLKGLHNGSRQARLKMSSSHLCLNYLKDKSEWPSFRDKKVVVNLSKKSKNKRKKNKKSSILKVYDGENEQKDISKTETKTSNDKQLKKSESIEPEEEDDVENEEDEDEEEEDEEEEDEDEDEGEEVDDEDEEEDE